MTSTDINQAVEEVLNNSETVKNLKLSRKDIYEYKNRRTLAAKLELLFRAQRLKIINGPIISKTEK